MASLPLKTATFFTVHNSVVMYYIKVYTQYSRVTLLYCGLQLPSRRFLLRMDKLNAETQKLKPGAINVGLKK